MSKPIKHRRGLSGRRKKYISRSALAFMAWRAQRDADRWQERWHVVRFRNVDGDEFYTVQPERFVHRVLDTGYIALTFEPRPKPSEVTG